MCQMLLTDDLPKRPQIEWHLLVGVDILFIKVQVCQQKGDQALVGTLDQLEAHQLTAIARTQALLQ